MNQVFYVLKMKSGVLIAFALLVIAYHMFKTRCDVKQIWIAITYKSIVKKIRILHREQENGN